MKLSDMISMVEDYIDDTVDVPSVVRMLNAGKNKMATAVRAKFPDVVVTANMDDEFVFDDKYHETPVLYASAMFKAQDSSIGEKGSFLSQFLDGVRDFSENYDPPMQYRDDELTQQFTATAGQTDYAITKDTFDPVYGNLKVYVNGKHESDFSLDTDTNTFTLTTASTEGDAVTALWEEHDDYVEPPYKWWSF